MDEKGGLQSEKATLAEQEWLDVPLITDEEWEW